MRASKFLASGAVLATLALPLAARAELTADQVWQDWQAAAAASGQTLTAGGTDRSGGRLTLSDLTVVAKGTGGRQATVTLPQVEMTERGAEVAIAISPEYTAVLDGATPAPGGGTAPERVTIGIAHPGLEMTASGAPGDVTYTYSAPLLTLDLREIRRAGEPVPGQDFELTSRSLSGRTHLTGAGTGTGTARRQEQEIRADSTTASFAFAGEGDASAQGRVTIRDASVTSDLTLDGSPAGLANPAFTGGRGELHYGALEAELDTGSLGRVTATFGAGRSLSSVDGGTLVLEGEASDGRVTVPGRGGNAPMEVAFARSASLARLPAEPTEAPQDMAASVTLERLTASESVWSLLDPRQVLPRDPANLLVDLAGRMRWLVDPSDPAAVERADRIAEIERLVINDVDLALAGARLTGRGDVTFPQPAPPGMPMPVGQIDLALTGGNTLLDRLTQIGLLPQDQAMMVRMMVAGFTRPGVGADSLVSRLDFAPDGSITANGRPLR